MRGHGRDAVISAAINGLASTAVPNVMTPMYVNDAIEDLREEECDHHDNRRIASVGVGALHTFGIGGSENSRCDLRTASTWLPVRHSVKRRA